MAQGRKKSSSAKSRSASQKSPSQKGRQKKVNSTKRKTETAPIDNFNEDLVNEIAMLGVIAFALLLFLCNFGILGTAGAIVSNVMFGIFGITAYIFPILAVYLLFLNLANPQNSRAIRRSISICVLDLLVAMLFEMGQSEIISKTEGVLFKDIFANSFSFAYENHKAGGLFGGLLANLLVKYLGFIGTILLTVVLIIICIVLITEKSFVNGVKGVSRTSKNALEKSAVNAQEKARQFSERNRQKKEENNRLRTEKEARQKAIKQAREDEKILNIKEFSGVPIYTLAKEETPLSNHEEGLHSINLSDKEENEIKEDNKNNTQDIFENNKTEEGQNNSSFLYRVDERPDSFSEIKADFDNADIYERPVYDHSFVTKGLDEFTPIEDDIVFNNVEKVKRNEFVEESANDAINNSNAIKEYYAEESLTEEPIKNEPLTQEEFYNRDFDEKPKTVTASLRSDYVSGDTNMHSARAIENQGSIFRSADSAPTNGGRTFGTSSGTASDIVAPPPKPKIVRPYQKPPISLLKEGNPQKNGDENELRNTARKLEEVLASFNVRARVTEVSQGPAVTRYEMIPEIGVKVSKILSLSDDIKLNLAAADIRIEAPIPGKAAIGIEVPNKESSSVALRDLIDTKDFKNAESKLTFAVGKDLTGKVIVTDIAKMPHMLIAGATGSGKSVCINTLIMSILYKAEPKEVKMIMIDPKVVELSVYNGIPHLLIPVVTDPKKANASLAWAVKEMDDRYKKFADYGVRDLKGYNAKIVNEKDINGEPIPPMYQLVVIVDELADLMMVAGKEVEESICRLAQLARAAGIHLIIATQRPSVDVITGLIKANMPSRISFAVSSGTDSRTILDMVGAEKLLGKGDMLFYPQGYTKPARVQGAFVSDKEVSDVVDFLKSNGSGEEGNDVDIFNVIASMSNNQSGNKSSSSATVEETDGQDEFFYEAGKLIVESGKCSIGMLQRKFKIGFNRAARIMDALSEEGVVGPEEGTKPRAILMSPEQFENYIETH